MMNMLRKKGVQLFAGVLFAMVMGTYGVLAVKYPMGYIWATYEDLFGEWIQFWCYVVTLVLSIRLVLGRSRYRPFFVLLALGCFYVAMEEISWGQRLLGFASPDYFRKNNLQSEANLHNLLTGPFTTTVKSAISYALAGALIIFGLVYPLTVHRRWRAATWLESRGLASPPLYLWPYFVTAGILELDFVGFNEAEVAEVLVGLGLVQMAILYAFSQRRGWSALQTGLWPTPAQFQLSARAGVATYCVLMHATITTLALYAVPSSRAGIENRIENGLDKFAGRYKRYGQWSMATNLYDLIRAKEPDNVANLRKLAECYRQTGDLPQYEATIRGALDTDLRRLKKDPGAASVHRSLVRTYDMLGDQAKAEEHLEKVLRIGLDRVQKHPTSGNAAYSLGRTYELMGKAEEAYGQFKRAVELDPMSKKFKTAYLNAKKDVEERDEDGKEED